MFKSLQFSWFKKPSRPLSPGEVPKSFTMAGGEDNHLYKVSMESTYADFVDVDFKKLSYAEAAALSKNKKQTSQVSLGKSAVQPGKVVARGSRAQPSQPGPKHSPASPEIDDDAIVEKVKTNNYFLKNKVYKKTDRNPKRRAL